MIRNQDLHLRAFLTNAVAGELQRIRSEIFGDGFVGVVLDNQSPTVEDVVEQPLLRTPQRITRVVRANPGDDCVVISQCCLLEVGIAQKRDLISDLPERFGNLIAEPITLPYPVAASARR